jgi:hypothetical protein
MDETDRVLDRLRRIDELRGAEARPEAVLRELRELLGEGEAWLARERRRRSAQGPEAGQAEAALDGLREALDRAATRAVEQAVGDLAEPSKSEVRSAPEG